MKDTFSSREEAERLTNYLIVNVDVCDIVTITPYRSKKVADNHIEPFSHSQFVCTRRQFEIFKKNNSNLIYD